ncbi:hypothetical protein EAH89_18805 [Roseomonas nepalensis]|uniref:DUF4384 domain-containing protein n=1 Tax=Muricoccus nepalensis TaxID=1854500 RepID=A0A502FSD0_9PROT|nr:hypothetical protein [Roseomonas nepalensis]TPG52290.1 hypothetical protein EAH89_18805 [Roseomonas nepalensis]
MSGLLALGAIALGLVQTMAEAVPGGVAGNVTDRRFCGLLRGILHRFSGMRASPGRAGVIAGIRSAQARALERSARACRAIAIARPAGSRDEALVRYLDRVIATSARTAGRPSTAPPLSDDVAETVSPALSDLLAAPPNDGPASGRARAVIEFIEKTVIDDLALLLAGSDLPKEFKVYLREGGPDGANRFIDLFVHAILEELNRNDVLRNILAAEELAAIRALLVDVADDVYAIGRLLHALERSPPYSDPLALLRAMSEARPFAGIVPASATSAIGAGRPRLAATELVIGENVRLRIDMPFDGHLTVLHHGYEEAPERSFLWLNPLLDLAGRLVAGRHVLPNKGDGLPVSGPEARSALLFVVTAMMPRHGWSGTTALEATPLEVFHLASWLQFLPAGDRALCVVEYVEQDAPPPSRSAQKA